MANRIITCPSCATKNRVPASAAGVPRCASCKAWLPWIVLSIFVFTASALNNDTTPPAPDGVFQPGSCADLDDSRDRTDVARSVADSENVAVEIWHDHTLPG